MKKLLKKFLSIVLVISLINFNGVFDFKNIKIVYATENTSTVFNDETEPEIAIETLSTEESVDNKNEIVDSETTADTFDFIETKIGNENLDKKTEKNVEKINETENETNSSDETYETDENDKIDETSEKNEETEILNLDNANFEFNENKIDINLEEYKNLDLMEQILKSSDNVKKEDEKIILTNDLQLKKPLYITNNENKLFLNGFTITAPNEMFAIWTNTEFYIDGGSLEDTSDVKKIGSIVGSNYKNYVIYAEYGDLFLNNVSVYGSNVGGNGIYLLDSNLTIDNTYIYGGKGEREDYDIGGNGGNAIVVDYKNSDYIIDYKSGIIKGGDGGDGYSDVAEGDGGSPVQLGLFYFTDGENLIEGGIGNFGGGDGGVGIQYINEINDLSFIKLNDNYVLGGSGGSSTRKSKKKKKLGASNLPSSFDLRKQTNQNGVLHSLVTSLHDQKGTGLCNTFTTIATAEHFLLKSHPEKVEEMGYAPIFQYTKNFPKEQRGNYTSPITGKKVSLSTLGFYENELDLSEAHLAYFLRYHNDDPLGNAGPSNTAPDEKGDRYFNVGSSTYEIPMFLSTFRPIVSEKTLSSQVMTNEINEVIKYKADTDGGELSDTEEGSGMSVGDKIWTEDDTINRNGNYEPAVILKSAKIVKSSNDAARHDEFIRELKENVYKNGATALLGNFRYWDLDPKKNELNTVEGTYDGEVNSLMCIPTYSGGGHAVTVIGWDDNFPVSKFTENESKYHSKYSFLEPKNNGALLIKQSTNGPSWTWIYYDSIFDSNWKFISYEWMLPKTYYDNNYYYDGGTATLTYNISQSQFSISKLANVFEIKNDNEKATAVSFVSSGSINVSNDNQKPKVQIYKTSGLDNAKKVGNYLVNKPVNLFDGVNFIELDEAIELEKGQTYAIAIDLSNVDTTVYKKIFVDGTASSYSSTPAKRNYTYIKLTSGGSQWTTQIASDYNYRIKLITTNNVKINFDANGGNFGGTNVINERRLYGEKILSNTIVEPTYEGHKFLGWSDDLNATIPNIDENNLFLLKDEKTYYAVYKTIESENPQDEPETNPTETSPTETEPTETSPTETEPTETSPTETSPTETSPTETEPTETSPTETSPTETEPTETSSTETKPTETEPTETSPTETKPTETEPTETSPTETKPTETEPTETSPTETKPTETETSMTESTTEQKPTQPSSVAPPETTAKVSTPRYSSGGSRSSGGRNTVDLARISGNVMGPTGSAKKTNEIISPTASPISLLIAPTESAVAKEEVIPLIKEEKVTNEIKTTNVSQLGIRLSKLSDVMAWGYDINTHNWNLTVFNNGVVEAIKNTFYVNEQSAITNANKLPDAYYLDNEGHLVTGWVKDSNGNSFYMEPKEGSEFGKMQRGWKEVEKGKWYYFQADGRLVKNTITPDGYYVNENGLYVET